jgi:hypothetical protein
MRARTRAVTTARLVDVRAGLVENALRMNWILIVVAR